MKPRLYHFLLLVLALSLGFGFIRATSHRYEGQRLPAYFLFCYVGGILAGAALVGGAYVAVESATRRPAIVWGYGRLCWAVAGFYLALLPLITQPVNAVRRMRTSASLPPSAGIMPAVSDQLCRAAVGQLALFLLALGICSALKPLPTPTRGDAVELSGRTFSALILLAYAANQLLRAFD